MRTQLVLALILGGSLFGPVALAKRGVPTEVAPVVAEGVEYRAPIAGPQGVVEAWDKASGKQLWWRQVYVVVRHLKLESDVQDIFVKKLSLEGDVLLVESEAGRRYTLALDTLVVTPVDGASAVFRSIPDH
jgi:hypothetical protein